MNHHELKIYREHYNNVRARTKTFAIRKNDRAFQKGDTVSLKCFDRDTNRYILNEGTPELIFRVGDVYPIDVDTVVFSLLEFKNV